MQAKSRTFHVFPEIARAARGCGAMAAAIVAVFMVLAPMPVSAQLFEESAIILAIRSGVIERVEEQFLAGYSANERSAKGETALIEAVRTGRKPLVELLLDRGARVNVAATRTNLTALEEATRLNRADLAQLLVDAGADVDKAGTGGETPVMIAAKQGQTEILEILIEANAYLNDTDSTGRTPLMLARERRHRAAVALLEASGAE